MEHGGYIPNQLDVDINVLAGDIWTKNKVIDVPFIKPTLLVPGNHEFYSGKIDTEVAKIKNNALSKNVIVLDNEEYIYNGVRFLGTTLWTNFQLFAGNDLAKIKLDAWACVGERHSGGVNDFRAIRVASENYRKFSPRHAALLYNKAVAWLESKFNEPYRGPTVVITHHAPSLRCVASKLLHDRRTAAYASNLDWLIERYQPAVWIHGHLHEAVPYFNIGNTRIISNPRGYPDSLNPNFNPNLVISV